MVDCVTKFFGGQIQRIAPNDDPGVRSVCALKTPRG